MPMDLHTHEALGLHLATPAKVNGRSNNDVLASLNHPDDEQYEPCPESAESASIPAGQFYKFKNWSSSNTYPDTRRDLAVHLPAEASDTPYAIAIFNDGAAYASKKGAARVTQVLDTLHAQREIPPTVAVFVNPGLPAETPAGSPTASYTPEATQRSLEYDALTPVYGRFLLDEVLPFVAGELDINLTQDPEQRTVAGISSGGIAAFSAAWFHPDEFRRVLSHCGSYTNILGGHNYPYLVRATPRKPIRVYLQSGEQDCTTIFGDWATANMAMAKALGYAGYDFHFEFGQGGHTLRHAGAVMADSLRWLWR